MARSVILAAIQHYPDLDGQELRRALNKHYPFGERKYYPYKIWCSETRLVCFGEYKRLPAKKRNQLESDGQESLW